MSTHRNCQESVTTNRVYDVVQVDFTDTESLYLTPKQARLLGLQLELIALDCEKNKFCKSGLKPATFHKEAIES